MRGKELFRITAKAELNCEIYKCWKNAGQFLSSEQPCELKSLDVALNTAGVEKVRSENLRYSWLWAVASYTLFAGVLWNGLEYSHRKARLCHQIKGEKTRKAKNDQSVASPSCSFLLLVLLKKTLKRSRKVVIKHLKVGSEQPTKDVDPFYGNLWVITEHKGGSIGFIVGTSIESLSYFRR